MSERGKRVFRFLLDQERDADVIGRIEAQPSMTGYVRELVRRDVHDERLDFAALKASELQAENAKLRELVRDMWRYAVNGEMELCNVCTCAGGDFCDCSACDEYDGACGIAKQRFEELYHDRMRELGVKP